MKFERKYLIGTLLCGLIPLLAAIGLVWWIPLSLKYRVLWSILLLALWLIPALFLKARLAFQLRTLSNLLGALREGDYSFKVKGACANDAMGELVSEVNALSQILHDERLDAVEATALLRKVLAEVDVALLGFDERERLCLINEYGEKLFGKPARELLKAQAADLGLADCLNGPTHQTMELNFPASTGRWELRRAAYREKGLPRQMLFLMDMTPLLHREERSAWKRLIQILRHEINNSLAPIQSVAESLQTCLRQDPVEGCMEDLNDGLEIIAERSEILGRFIESYSQLTRLPEPTFEPMSVAEWIEHAAGLEQRVRVTVREGAETKIRADRSQLDQLLINLVSNAVEAALEKQAADEARVSIEWLVTENKLEVRVSDNGPGCDPSKDLFVPFFTSKPEGSGIGLALSRQIAEAHGGTLQLHNREALSGCQAVLRLPIAQAG